MLSIIRKDVTIYITTDGEHDEYRRALLNSGFVHKKAVDSPDFYLIGALIWLNDSEKEIKIEYNDGCEEPSSNIKTVINLAEEHLNIEKVIDEQGNSINLESLFGE